MMFFASLSVGYLSGYAALGGISQKIESKNDIWVNIIFLVWYPAELSLSLITHWLSPAEFVTGEMIVTRRENEIHFFYLGGAYYDNLTRHDVPSVRHALGGIFISLVDKHNAKLLFRYILEQ